MTAVAVLTGVALVTGTLILTDAVGRSVRRLTAGAQAGVNVVLDNAGDPDAGPPQAIRPALVAAVAGAPGVARRRRWWSGRRRRWSAATAGPSATGARRTWS